MTAPPLLSEATLTTNQGDRLALRMVARIPIAGPVPDTSTVSRPLGVAADARGRVYVTLLMWRAAQKIETNTPAAVAVIDDATQTVVAYVPVGVAPRYLATDPVTSRVFVTHNAQPKSDTITVIDGAAVQPSVIATLREGRNVLGVAINPLTRRVYVAQSVDAHITVIDADSLAVLGQIALENGIQLDRITVDAATNQIYVPASRVADQPATPWLYVIDGATQTWSKVSLAIADPILTQGTPRSVAFNPATRQLYVAKFGNVNNVAVLDASDLGTPPRLVTTIGGVGGNASDIAVDAARNLVFVANSTAPGLGKIGLGMSAIDGATSSVFTLPKETPQPAKMPSGAWELDVVQGSGRIYITTPDDLSILVAESARLPRTTGEILSLGEGRWTEPTLLAGTPLAAPVLVATAPGMVELFALASDGTVWHQVEVGGRWDDGESLGGSLAFGPAALLDGPMRLELFGTGADGALWRRARQDGQWAAWESLGGALASAPAAVLGGAEHVELFAVGTDGALWGRSRQGEQWAAWESLGGALAGTPAALLDSAGQLHVFALGTDGALWHRQRQGQQWAAWESLGGALTSSPAAVVVEPNQLHVFAMGEDGTLQHRAWDGAAWAGWESLGEMLAETDVPPAATGGPALLSVGALAPAPVAVVAGKRIDVLAAGPSGSVQHIASSGGKWLDWQKVATETGAKPAYAAIGQGKAGIKVATSDSKGVWGQDYDPFVRRLRVLRHQDLLNLEFDLINLEVQAGNPPQLVRAKPFDPAYIVAYFAPQNIYEEAFFKSESHLQVMPPSIESHLMNGNLSDDVRDQFDRFGYPLSAQAVLTPQGPGRWKVADPTTAVPGQRMYTIEKLPAKPGFAITAGFDRPQPDGNPVRARLANRSWLVFKVPDTVTTIPYTYEGLLAACRSSLLQVAPVARAKTPPTTSGAAPPLIAEPKPVAWSADGAIFQGYTAIELPYGLVLSPDQWQHWHHATEIVSRQLGSVEWSELWHTRLEPPENLPLPAGSIVVQPGAGALISTSAQPAGPKVRAIWARDFEPELEKHKLLSHYQDAIEQGDPGTPEWKQAHYTALEFRASLDAKDRSELVHLTSNFSKALQGVRSDVEVERIMLSALGGWIRARGVWAPKPANLNIEEWRHQGTMGRDHYVRVVYGGYLMPFGHKASLVKITERMFTPPNMADFTPSVAYLRQRMYIIVREPVREFLQSVDNLHNSDEDLLLQMPFARMRIVTRSTPNIDPPENMEAFWPAVGKKEFMFHLVAHDRAGQEIDFQLPLLFVSNEMVAATPDLAIGGYKNVAAGWSDARRKAQLYGQRVAFAPNSAGADDNTTFECEEMLFGVLVPDTPVDPPFYPVVERASVRIPAIERLMQQGLKLIQYTGAYKLHGFKAAGNVGQVLAELVNEKGEPKPLELNFTAEGAPRLGLVTPNMTVNGLSRSHGPIANPDTFSTGQFDPAALFAKGVGAAKILGGVDLADIVPGGSLNNAPMLTIAKDKVWATTKLEWTPQVTSSPSGAFKITDKITETTSLKVLVELKDPLVVTVPPLTPTSKTSTTLQNFTINLFGAVRVTFNLLEFVSENGSKPDVHAEGLGVEFIGPLSFVQDLARLIPAEGFEDPPFLDIVPTGADAGVNAGFSTAIPSIAVGMFNLQNIALLAALRLPFNGDPASLRFTFAQRQDPFVLTVGALGGGGFFGLDLGLQGIQLLEASLEFGGAVELNLGVAKGGVSIMGGVYFKMAQNVELTGYVRVHGAVEVLGLIAITLECSIGLTYTDSGKLYGQATVSVEVDIGFFSKSVHIKVERQFRGSGQDPTFQQLVSPPQWLAYLEAFAPESDEDV